MEHYLDQFNDTRGVHLELKEFPEIIWKNDISAAEDPNKGGINGNWTYTGKMIPIKTECYLNVTCDYSNQFDESMGGDPALEYKSWVNAQTDGGMTSLFQQYRVKSVRLAIHWVMVALNGARAIIEGIKE